MKYQLKKQLKKYLNKKIEFFNKAIELNLELAAAYDSKGIALYESKRYEDNLNCFNKAIEFDSTNISAQNYTEIIEALLNVSLFFFI